jgi:hypothetical protein
MQPSKRGRKLRVLMAALPVAGIMSVVGVGTAALLTATASPAAADTGSYEVSCTGVPVISTANFASDVTGTISPNPVDSGAAFSLGSTFGLDFTVAGSLVGIATTNGNATVSGSVQFDVDATGATPATTSVTATIPTTTLTASEDTTGAEIEIPISPSPSWNASGTATSATLTAGTAYSVALSLNGTAVPAFSCTAPSEPIDTTTITPTPYISASPNSYAFVSSSDSTNIGISGGNWEPDSTVSLGWTSGSDTSTCSTDGSGNIIETPTPCTIPASESGEVVSNQAPFTDYVTASGDNNSDVAATATSNGVLLTPFVSLNTFCDASTVGLSDLTTPPTQPATDGQGTAPENPLTITQGSEAGQYTLPITEPPYSAAIGCDPKQQIDADVLGSYLYIWETLSPANAENPYATHPPAGDAAHVILSPVQLGLDDSAANIVNGGNLTPCAPPFTGTSCGPAVNNGQFDQALGQLNTVTVQDDRGTLTGWTVTGQLQSDFNNQTPIGPPGDNVIPADFLTWDPSVSLTTPGSLPANNGNTLLCPDQSSPPTDYPSCNGPSGTPAGTGGAPVNGTGTSGVTDDSTPAEVFPGQPEPLNNLSGSADVLCATNLSDAGGAAGGGGTFNCNAGLSLAVPPYVAEGDYRTVLDITILGF